MMKKFKNMKKTLMILMAVALVALPTMAQQNWRTQQSLYGRPYQPQRTMTSTTTYHNSTFRSSGTYQSNSTYQPATRGGMMSSGSAYTARPMINANGTAVYGGAPRQSAPKGSSGPHKGLINWGSGDDSGGGITGGGEYEEGDPIIVPGGGGGGGGGLVTPDSGDDDDRPNGSPIGDAVLPLLLMALAFCGYVYFRRKRSKA